MGFSIRHASKLTRCDMPVKQLFDTGWSWWSNPLLLLLSLCASVVLKFQNVLFGEIQFIIASLIIAYDAIHGITTI